MRLSFKPNKGRSSKTFSKSDDNLVGVLDFFETRYTNNPDVHSGKKKGEIFVECTNTTLVAKIEEELVSLLLSQK